MVQLPLRASIVEPLVGAVEYCDINAPLVAFVVLRCKQGLALATGGVVGVGLGVVLGEGVEVGVGLVEGDPGHAEPKVTYLPPDVAASEQSDAAPVRLLFSGSRAA